MFGIFEFQPIEPLLIPKLASRPRKIRVRDSNEPKTTSYSDGKLPRKRMIQSCSICHKEGHNRMSCLNKGHQVWH